MVEKRFCSDIELLTFVTCMHTVNYDVSSNLPPHLEEGNSVGICVCVCVCVCVKLTVINLVC